MSGSRKENDLSEENKENVDTFSGTVSVKKGEDKENVSPDNTSVETRKQDRALKSQSMKGNFGFPTEGTNFKSFSTGGRTALKQTSLQACMQMNSEVEKGSFGMKTWTSVDSEHSSSLKVWEFSDSEAAPASSWSTLPNR